jgi:hypothetical protein
VEFAQHRHDRFRGHGLCHLREADNISKQHGNRLPADCPERLILRSQQLDDVRRKITSQIVARPLAFALALDDLAAPVGRRRRPGNDQDAILIVTRYPLG